VLINDAGVMHEGFAEPGHPHWGQSGEFRARLPAEPVQVADRAGLRRRLLRRPWDTDSARWLVAAGIGRLRGPVLSAPTHLPGMP
jgi:hypothetical protein